MKQPYFHKIISVFLLSLLLCSCVSEFNAELPASDSNLLVIEGTIISDMLVTFQLSKSISINEDLVPPEKFDVRATLTIIGNDGSQTEPALYWGAGKYEIRVGHLNEDVAYGVRVEYDGNIYQSALTKPLSTPEIDSVSWKQPVKDGDVSFYVSTHSNESRPEYFLWNYEEDWEITANYYVTIFYNPLLDKFYLSDTDSLYYCWRKNRINKILIGTTETYTENRILNQLLYQQEPTGDQFSYLYAVNVIQQSIDKAGYEYYLNKLKTNEEMGGLFTPQPSDLIGNISCITDPALRAAGYINVVKNVASRRIFIKRAEISRPWAYSNCTQELPPELANYSPADLYMANYRPVELLMPTPGSEYPSPANWSTVQCTDCTRNGGSKNKPAFWPNDHQ
jgi:hypothetical protein